MYEQGNAGVNVSCGGAGGSVGRELPNVDQGSVKPTRLLPEVGGQEVGVVWEWPEIERTAIPSGWTSRRKSARAMKPAKSAESWTESRSKPTQVSIVRALVSTPVPTPTTPPPTPTRRPVGASGGPWVWNTPWGSGTRPGGRMRLVLATRRGLVPGTTPASDARAEAPPDVGRPEARPRAFSWIKGIVIPCRA